MKGRLSGVFRVIRDRKVVPTHGALGTVEDDVCAVQDVAADNNVVILNWLVRNDVASLDVDSACWRELRELHRPNGNRLGEFLCPGQRLDPIIDVFDPRV